MIHGPGFLDSCSGAKALIASNTVELEMHRREIYAASHRELGKASHYTYIRPCILDFCKARLRIHFD